MNRRRRTSLLGMRILHRLRWSPGGESASREVLLRDLDLFFYHRRESLTLTSCVLGSTPTGLMNSVLIENNRSVSCHGDDSDHR